MNDPTTHRACTPRVPFQRYPTLAGNASRNTYLKPGQPHHQSARRYTPSIVEARESLLPGPVRESPDRAFDEQATRACLLDAVERLPPCERGAILAYEFGDKPLTRTAAELNCSLGAAKVRVHRGRHRLSEICRAECVEQTTAEGDVLCAPRPIRTGRGRH